MNRRNLAAGIPLLAVYIASVVLANWLTTRYGFVAVFPGLTTTAGTVAIGGVIMTRDFLQDALGRAAVLAAVAVGAALSYAVSSHAVALASALTFLVAETLEFGVYTPLRRRVGWGTSRWAGVVSVANATGAVADTLIFLSLAGYGIAALGLHPAFGPHFQLTAPVVAGQLVGKAYVTAAVILAARLARGRSGEQVPA